MDEISIELRRQLAQAHGLDERYLYQCLTGRRQMDAATARSVEEASAGALRRWQLRRNDWHRIWPELVGADGAPAVPAEAAAG